MLTRRFVLCALPAAAGAILLSERKWFLPPREGWPIGFTREQYADYQRMSQYIKDTVEEAMRHLLADDGGVRVTYPSYYDRFPPLYYDESLGVSFDG